MRSHKQRKQLKVRKLLVLAFSRHSRCILVPVNNGRVKTLPSFGVTLTAMLLNQLLNQLLPRCYNGSFIIGVLATPRW